MPQPCAALILLFPCAAISTERRRELKSQRDSQPPPPAELFFAQQHDECGNACGTIAVVHAVANAAAGGLMALDGESPLAVLLRDDPGGAWARGRALVASDAIRLLSNETARAGQTQGAGTDDNQGQHYVAFVALDGLLWELDGRNIGDDGVAFPVCHGGTDAFLSDAAALIQTQFIARDPDNPHFSILAFANLE